VAAYGLYAAGVTKLVERLGGRVVFAGKVHGLLVGRVDELWDTVAIAQYPSFRAMMDMTSSAEFKQIEVHREAGLQGQLNLECRTDPPASPGAPSSKL
jgi:uncharacterized protein (DUF1330 family)